MALDNPETLQLRQGPEVEVMANWLVAVDHFLHLLPRGDVESILWGLFLGVYLF